MVLVDDQGEHVFGLYDLVDTIVTTPDTLLAMAFYSWAVDVYTTSGKRNRGPFWRFTTGDGFNTPPVPPFNPDPVDLDTGVSTYATLNWDCFDPEGNDLTYDVWLDTFDGGSVLVGDKISTKSVDPGGLERGKRYDWIVVAYASDGDTAIGDWWSFKTIPAVNKPPVEPWGPYPADDATHVPLNVTLTWNCSDPEDDPITYDVAMGYAGGNLTVIGSDLSAASFDVTGLDLTTEYEWLVSASDNHDHTTPGPVWSFTTSDGSQVSDIFAVCTLRRSITYDGSVISRNDYISARFDSVYAPHSPIVPKQPASVSCREFDLVWQASGNMFFYSDYIAGYFLDPGTTYNFTVGEGGGVPPLTTDPIGFPVCAPYITSPAPFSMVSMNGFDLEWHTFCSGRIDITIMDLNADSTGVYIRTEDDGAYTFTADDLSVIDPSAYQLQIVLITEDRKTITAPGYDPRSWIWARTLSSQVVMKE